MWQKAVFNRFNSIHRHSTGETGENKVKSLSKRSYETDLLNLSTACRRAVHAALRHAATSPNLYNDVILLSVLA